MKTIYREWIGKKLKELRELMGWSQAQVAAMIGKQKRTYGKYEEGHAEPSIYTLKKLCKIFSTTLDEFMQNSPEQTTTTG